NIPIKHAAKLLRKPTRPALDCPVIFPYAPNAVLVGFLSSFAAGLIGMFTLYLLNIPIKPAAKLLRKPTRPALDCPVIFPYAPNAVLVGFLSSFAA
ncbi:PTS transporter subunit IIC, partial [Escherichia coli]|uniref:PTS transporter subunit IIC n=1 Tax=Escherichia coli TaxID=562 RepID=UPI003005AD53